MSWSPDFAVLVASFDGQRKRLLGSGFLVAPGRVVTARHVVLDTMVDARYELRVKSECGFWCKATIVWSGRDYLDVAVLETTHDGVAPAPAHALELLVERDVYAAETWETHGYPTVCDDPPNEKLVPIHGSANSCRVVDCDLLLDALSHPGIWGGLSGAPVVIGAKVVGVIRSVPKGWDKKRIAATPVARFLHDADFCEAAGIKEVDAKLRTRIEAVRDRIETILRRLDNHDFTQRLAKLVGVDNAAGAASLNVATAFVQSCHVAQVAAWLDQLDAEFARVDAAHRHRRVVRELLDEALPASIDLRGLVHLGRASLDANDRSLPLPLYGTTIAEAVMAGVDGRPCIFDPERREYGLPIAVARVLVPASTGSVGFDPYGDQCAEQVTEAIIAAQRPRMMGASRDAKRKVVGELLRHRAEAAPDGERYSFYIVFEHRDRLEERWQVMVERFELEVPRLVLVRLSELPHDGEVGAEQSILGILDRTKRVEVT